METVISDSCKTKIYNLRGNAILKLFKVKFYKVWDQVMDRRYQAARLWNTISNNLRNIDKTTAFFKRELKELDLRSLFKH